MHLAPTNLCKRVPYAKVKGINFKSARKLKYDLDTNRTEELASPSSKPEETIKKSKTPTAPIPTEGDLKTLYTILNECKIKSVALSLVEPYSQQFVLKSRNIPSVCNLFDPVYVNLTYPELLEKCEEIDITLSDTERDLIEKDYRTQAKGTAFFKHRAGCIGASQCYAVSHTNPAMPSQSYTNLQVKQHLMVARTRVLQ